MAPGEYAEWDGICQERDSRDMPRHSDGPPRSQARSLVVTMPVTVLEVCSAAGADSVFLGNPGIRADGMEISGMAVAIASLSINAMLKKRGGEIYGKKK